MEQMVKSEEVSEAIGRHFDFGVGKAPTDMEALGRKLDALIKIELYNNKILLGRHGQKGLDAHEEFKQSLGLEDLVTLNQ